jgi:hypothetical protein
MTISTQPNLFAGSPPARKKPERSSPEAFLRFHRAHPEIYRLLVEKARLIRNRGIRHYSMRTIWEVLRWHADLGRAEHEDYKLNDHYPPYYARLIMHQEPDLQGFFELRGRKR